MANTRPTLLDAIQDRECSRYVSMVVKDPTEIFDAYTETMDEMEFKVLVETSLGDFSFRNINSTSKITMPQYDVRRFECSVANPLLSIDWALYETAKSNGKLPDYIARIKKSILDGVFKTLGQQFYYGRGVKSKGPEGIFDLMYKGMAYSAGGSTANSQTSIVAIKWGPEYTGITYGGGVGKIFNWSPIRRETVRKNDEARTEAVSDFTMYPCIYLASPYSVGRIANVQSTLTDNMIMDALSKWSDDFGFVPDVLYMRPSTLGLLRKSRTATNPAGEPAPFPDQVANIPIKTTQSISKTEAVVANLTSL